MANDTRRLLGGSALFGAAVMVFAFRPLPIANALYACGLWPRLTPDEVLVKLQRHYRWNVSECVTGTNGWQYICQMPGRPGIRQFYSCSLGERRDTPCQQSDTHEHRDRQYRPSSASWRPASSLRRG